jgi:hypothetical protein
MLAKKIEPARDLHAGLGGFKKGLLSVTLARHGVTLANVPGAMSTSTKKRTSPRSSNRNSLSRKCGSFFGLCGKVARTR